MQDSIFRAAPLFKIARLVSLAAIALGAMSVCAQEPAVAPPASASVANYGPIAIVPLDAKTSAGGPTVTGALEVTQGKAVIVASGTITAGTDPTLVTLPRRGALRICASTTVKLAADSSVPAGDAPGLLMAIDRGAIEASFATGRNSDVVLTPDFRILISGPGSAEVKIRLGQHGDTCVDNAGTNPPYVLVTSVFDAGDYRVQPGQRVMFEHGSLQEVVDHEKEPCGCPPSTTNGNEFPLAQSEGLAPTPAPVAAHGAAQPIPPLVYKAEDHTPPEAAAAAPAAPPPPAPAQKKPSRIAGFFRKLFGAK
jgi:hypothetical protein